MSRTVTIGSMTMGAGHPLVLIAGPCVIEGRQACLKIARRLAALAREEKIPLIFKASYDKANRTSVHGFRGKGVAEGLAILAEVKAELGIPILTDVHSEKEVDLAAEVVDVLQLPAFLCRQTDLLLALGRTGKPVNLKKGQFLAPWDMKHVVAKVESTGNRKIIVTERGASFGYNNLVADMRSLLVLREIGYPVVFDVTHSVQLPGGGGDKSGGEGRWAPAMARAATATGCDGLFIETHINPAKALSDGANMVPLAHMRNLWRTVRSIDELVRT